MNIAVVVVTVLLVVVVVTAAGLLLRSIVASSRTKYLSDLGDLRQVREDHAEGFETAAIRVDPDDWPSANVP
jgi:uncharacterized protein YxeA